jgi:hypothetical protein
MEISPQRPIGVAVSGYNGARRSAMDFSSSGEFRQTIELVVGNIFRIDGNEGVAPPDGHDLGAELARTRVNKSRPSQSTDKMKATVDIQQLPRHEVAFGRR